MATKRKPAKPKGYKDGGAVIPPEGTASAPEGPPPSESGNVSETETFPSAAPAPEGTPPQGDAVLRAAEAASRAEELQSMTVEQYIDRIPDLTDHKRNFLKKFPLLLQEENARAMRRHRKAAFDDGVEDDSEAMDERILSGFAADLRAQREREAERVTPSDMISRPPEIERIAPEAAIDPEIEKEALRPFTPPGLPPSLPHAGPARGRVPGVAYSAPVSREAPSYSGKRVSDSRTVTLSPLERELARNSFGPIQGKNGEMIDLTNAQKERMYAENKARLAALRASGEYRITTERDG